MLRWLLLLLFVPVLPALAQDDPEATPEGRDRYLGREIARTMHWTGASWLLRQTRDAEENGARLRAWLDVQPGEAVCDFGCGNGYHTLPLAEAVGPEGRVLAVDLQVQMLTLLRERLDEKGLENVELIEASIDDPHLAPDSCDTVLMVDVYHELSHPVRVLEHVRTALRPTLLQPGFRDLELGVQVSLGEGESGLSGVPVDVAFDNQRNFGGLTNIFTTFSAGAPNPQNGKGLIRIPVAAVVNTTEPQYMVCAVPNANGGFGVVDVMEVGAAGVPRRDTNAFEAGIQSVQIPNVTVVMDYWRQ